MTKFTVNDRPVRYKMDPATPLLWALRDASNTQQIVEQNLAAITTALGHAGQQYAEIEQANARLFTAR